MRMREVASSRVTQGNHYSLFRVMCAVFIGGCLGGGKDNSLVQIAQPEGFPLEYSGVLLH